MELKRTILAILAFAGVAPLYADEAATDEKILNLRVEARLDMRGDWLDGHTVKDNTGFAGRYLNLRLDGNITPNLRYSWRQRFNKPPKDASFFDATDWIYLNYNLGNWSFSGGKEVVAIGGWEYDRAPIDLYGCSVFWNNIPCYEIGASVGLKVSPADKLSFQFCQSPFFLTTDRNMYAYNLMWVGNHGCYSSIYSANLMEYAPGRYINYLALGNKFTVDNVVLELDLMNRASSHQTFIGKDMSIMAELQYKPAEKWNVFGKFTYDVNKSGTSADVTVLNGTELKMVGAGVEFMPFVNAKHVLRFHATGFYSWGRNVNSADLMQNKTFTACAGVTWYMNLLSLKRK
ncbi:MAG: OprO/OprP family phosphate-selective porin [Muribaculaceae bacterium]|nr:OprO/OprP family phosphate-selective porin [Muribaculaceae bacterium]